MAPSSLPLEWSMDVVIVIVCGAGRVGREVCFSSWLHFCYKRWQLHERKKPSDSTVRKACKSFEGYTLMVPDVYIVRCEMFIHTVHAALVSLAHKFCVRTLFILTRDLGCAYRPCSHFFHCNIFRNFAIESEQDYPKHLPVSPRTQQTTYPQLVAMFQMHFAPTVRLICPCQTKSDSSSSNRSSSCSCLNLTESCHAQPHAVYSTSQPLQGFIQRIVMLPHHSAVDKNANRGHVFLNRHFQQHAAHRYRFDILFCFCQSLDRVVGMDGFGFNSGGENFGCQSWRWGNGSCVVQQDV